MSSKNPDLSTSLEARFKSSVYRLTRIDASIDTESNRPADDLPSASDAKKTSLLIALSGGVDSVVLLSLASSLRNQYPVAVRAIYVDHGLQQQSAQWSEFCASLCTELSVPFASVQVSVDLESGLSPEAAARDARYAALRCKLQPEEYLCTAHHADDQAETLLLQAFRGAGVHGLASMPALCEFGGGYLLRPLLRSTRAEILGYAEDYGLRWCEDPSNAELRYDRNYVRNNLLPVAEQRWPHVISNLSRSASHCAETMELLQDLAKLDFAGSCADAGIDANTRVDTGTCVDSSGSNAALLSITYLQTLSDVRKKNLLRYWIAQHGFQTPSTIQLQQILNDLVITDDASLGRINFGGAQIARYQDLLFIGERNSFEPLPDFEYQWDDTSAPLAITELNWLLDISAQPNLKACAGQPLLVRNRRGGERWRADPAGHSISVKSLLQHRRIPPWQRSRLVFVFSDNKLVDICGPGFVL